MLRRLLLIAAMLFVQICCIPPLEAAVMVCPITGQKCEASADCDPGPPVAAAVIEAPAVAAPQIDGIEIPNPIAIAHPKIVTNIFWSAPTRTTVLRI